MHVGFDIGGTNLKAGIVDESLKIRTQRSVPFPTGGHYSEVVSMMVALIKDMTSELKLSESDIQSIGIAVPGDIDPAGKTVINAHNLGFREVPLHAAMTQFFPDTPIFLANDANAAALAELHAGVFRGCKTAILFTLGTGVGGGVILGGRMFNGGLNHGVELGHMVLNQGGDVCTCGNKGCVETRCNAPWLIRQGRIAMQEHPDSLLSVRAGGSDDNMTAKMVIDCAKAGDPFADQIFQSYIDALSSAICSCTNLLDPEVVALGGGVSLAGDFLIEPLRRQVQDKSFFKHPYPIVLASMGNDAGIVGAAMLFQNVRQ